MSTLIEALKSGKRIRNKDSDDSMMQNWFSTYDMIFYFRNRDIVLDGWEIEPEPLKPIVLEGVVWDGTPGDIRPTGDNVAHLLRHLLKGQRTRVTIEVIE